MIEFCVKSLLWLVENNECFFVGMYALIIRGNDIRTQNK